MTFRNRLGVRTWLALAGLVIFAIAMLPRVVSSRMVYGPLLDRLKAENFKLDVGSVQLRWFSPIHLNDISIEQLDRPGFKLLSVDEVITEKGLLGFLLSQNQLGRWEIMSPVIDVELLQDGSNVENLARALSGDVKDKKTPSRRPVIDLDVSVKGASVVVRKGDVTEPLVVVPPWDVELAFRSISGEPVLRIEPTRWLDHVQLTPELMNLGLELAVPTLAQSAWIDGEVSLESGEVRVPLDAVIESTGQCEITFHSVRTGLQQPAMVAVTNMLAKLVGSDSSGEVVLVDGSQVNVEWKDGFVYHEGTRFGLPRLDSRLQVETKGRVGIVDRSLEATIQFPIPLQWLARTSEVKEMGVPTVKLPVTGSLDEPQIQWSAMRQESAELLSVIGSKLGEDASVKSAMVGALEGLASGSGDDAIRATADLIGQLRDFRKQRTTSRNESEAENEMSDEKNTGDSPLPRLPTLREILRRRGS